MSYFCPSPSWINEGIKSKFIASQEEGEALWRRMLFELKIQRKILRKRRKVRESRESKI